MASLPDRYLADLIRHGGSSLGKPGMPSFGFVLSDAEIDALVQYVRSLPRAPRDLGRTGAAYGLARWPTRDLLIATRLHALTEDARVEVAKRGELHAV
jgi:hypothetical protein